MLKDQMSLKFGQVKSWSLNTPEARRVGTIYIERAKATKWEDWDGSDEQKRLVCDIIDALDGRITSDWTGELITKDEAKRYIMGEFV